VFKQARVNRTNRPYKGLQPYFEEDAQFFFGREEEVGLIIANLWASCLTLLYGESGVGKSSLLQAGVAYNLGHVALNNLKRHGKPRLAVVVFNSWRDDPVGKLKRSIQEAVDDAWQGNRVTGDLQAESLPGAVQLAAQSVSGRLFVILDQFEEYLLYHQPEGSAGSFDYEFPLTLKESAVPVSFLLSINADMLAKLDRFKSQIPGLFENSLRVALPTRKATRDLILKSLQSYNASFATDDRIEIEPALLDEVIKQVTKDKTDQVEIPFLQLVMMKIFEKEIGEGSRVLRLQTLETLGGARGTVARHLDKFMSTQTVAEQRVAMEIFKYLVSPSETIVAYSASELASVTKKLTEHQIANMLEKLSDPETRILRLRAPTPNEPNVRRYELSHERLARPILDWRKKMEAIFRSKAWLLPGFSKGTKND